MTKVFLCVLVLLIVSVCLEGKPKKGKGKGKGHGYGWGNKGGGSSHDSKEKDDFTFEDGEVALITCPTGSFINITSARYGTKWQECDPDAFQKVSDLCEGRETCNFMVDDAIFDEGDCYSGRRSWGSRNLRLKIDFECTNPCEGFCCANGGECMVNTTNLTPECVCTGNWTGPNCDDNPCEELICVNGGSCRVDPADGSASCICPNGFMGDNCSVEACWLVECQNGGSCQQTVDGITSCICPPNTKGPNCEIDCNAVQTCPSGFQELPAGSGKCYFICPSDSESWLSAEATCLAMGATLWEPASSTGPDVTAITDALTGSEKYWTGGFDGVEEGSPLYVGSGSAVSLGPSTDASNSAEKDCIEVFQSGGSWVFEYRTCQVSTRRCICQQLGPCETPQISLPGLPVTGKK